MTPRSIRRAAERKANKIARKAAVATENQLPSTDAEASAETPSETLTPAIPPAAAANIHLSAITSALTGHATLLPAADAASYTQLLRDYQNEFQPVGLQECNLVQTLAETTWRARRTLALEMAIFAQGRIEFAPQFAEHNPELRESLIDVHTFLTYEKQIRGLQLQEARLVRRADKASAELRTLQKERRQREEHARPKHDENRQHQSAGAAQSTQNGFVFSNQYHPAPVRNVETEREASATHDTDGRA
jgi:hypothetical protein